VSYFVRQVDYCSCYAGVQREEQREEWKMKESMDKGRDGKEYGQ
jgi:hypothetical protein